MIFQEKIFLKKEADNFYKRNKKKFSKKDNLYKIIINQGSKIKNVKKLNILEVGCADGARLAMVKEKLNCNCYGIEPSSIAIKNKIDKNIIIKKGIASKLNFNDKFFDIIIYGFCLYLVDISKLSDVFKEADRVSKDKSIIIVKDFYSKKSKVNNYKRFKNIKVHKYDFSKIFTWHPNYTLINKIIYPYEDKKFKNDKLSIATLIKSSNAGIKNS